MKTLKLIILGIVIFMASAAQAQVSVNVNIGSPPLWGPVGYSEVNYYYLPDVEAYYDVHSSMFIYYSGGVWLHRANLPTRYRSYDLYNGYKVVMTDYRGNTPYTHFKEHKSKYGRGYHGPAQKTIGQRPERGNSGEKHHSEGNPNRMKNQGHGNDNNMKRDNGHGGGKDGGNNGGHGKGK